MVAAGEMRLWQGPGCARKAAAGLVGLLSSAPAQPRLVITKWRRLPLLHPPVSGELGGGWVFFLGFPLVVLAVLVVHC